LRAWSTLRSAKSRISFGTPKGELAMLFPLDGRHESRPI
jgi:hypothetical protein